MTHKTNLKTSPAVFVFLPLMIVLMAQATSVYGRGPLILLVSDCAAPGTYTGVAPYDVPERDNTLVSFLQTLGYAVDTSGMNKAYQEGRNPFSDPARLAAIDAADLIFVSRHTDSLCYDADRQNWNTLQRPLLLMNGYLTRGGVLNRWGWTTGASADADFRATEIFFELDHPFVVDFPYWVSTTAFDWSESPTPGQAPKGVFLPNSPPVAGALVICTFDDMPILMDIPAGANFDAGNTGGPYGIAGERRALMGTWSYDIDLPAPYDRPAGFTDFLTRDYLTVLTRTLDEMVVPNPPETMYVDADAPLGGDGHSWPTAFKYLQDALTIAWTGDEIRVAQGTYKPDAAATNPSGTGNRAATFRLKTGVAVYGGYAGLGQPNPDARNTKAYPTILSGDIGIVDAIEDNSYHVVTTGGIDHTTVLDGFTVTGGNADGAGRNGSGGGMLDESGSPAVTHCTFTANFADQGGGMCSLGSPVITNCAFSANSATRGGGMYSGAGSVTNCTFSANSATQGGGMYSGFVRVRNCTFSANSATQGGGMYSSFGSATNCTFSANSAAQGGGVFTIMDDHLTVTNCILWGNTASSGPLNLAAITYSDVQGGYDGTGNIDADPCFVDPSNLRLKPNSPCIDAGSSTPLLNAGISHDADGLMRFVDIDSVDDTGTGPLQYVDMGAYEFDCRRTPADINCDGDVNVRDLAILAANWLAQE